MSFHRLKAYKKIEFRSIKSHRKREKLQYFLYLIGNFGKQSTVEASEFQG